MAHIELTHVSLDIPLYDYSATKLIKSKSNLISSKGQKTTRNVVRALNDINFELRDGDRLGLVGKNGSGKTTLLRLLAGVYSPTGGTIQTEGRISSLLDISFGIEPDLTGRESIDLRARILGIPPSLVEPKKDSIIQFSGLGTFIDMPTRTYSSGMLVRLAFSITTLMTPEILIMDEWLSVGDEDFRKMAEKKLQSTVAQTKILVLASHSRELISHVCNRAIWLENGEVRASGEPVSVCEMYFGPRSG